MPKSPSIIFFRNVNLDALDGLNLGKLGFNVFASRDLLGNPLLRLRKVLKIFIWKMVLLVKVV